MNTKIEGLGPAVPRPSSAASAPVAAPRGAGGERGRVGAGDSVQLSGEAAGLASLQRELASSPGYDEAKVAALRTMLDTGTYRVNPQEIAARLAQLERVLGA